MVKRLILLASVVTVGYFLYYGFQQMKIAQTPKPDLYSQVPLNAYAVLEINDFPEQYDDLKSNSIIWEKFQRFGQVQDLNKLFTQIDSISPSTMNQLELFPSVIISLTTTKETESFLIQFQKENTVQTEYYANTIAEITGFKLSKVETHFELKNNNKSELFLISHQGIVSISNNVQELYRITKSETSFLLSKSDFRKVKKTSSKSISTRLFILPETIIQKLESISNDNVKLDLHLSPTLSSWVELDVAFKPDEISMGGFAYALDSLNHWISVFKGQEAMEPKVIDYLPNKTAFFLHYGFSDFQTLKNNIDHHQNINSGFINDNEIAKWDSLYALHIQDQFVNWIDNEIAISIVEPEHSEVESEVIVWINSSDGVTLFNNLKDLSLKIDNQEGLQYFQLDYKGHSIYKLNLDVFLKKTLGQQFEIIAENYFTRFDDYLVFSNSPATLQWCVDRYKNGKTLAKNPSFKNLSKRISEKSNIFIYSDFSKSTDIFKHWGSNSISSEIDKHLEFFHQFQGAVVQISHEADELFYVNNILKYSPINKQMPNTIWETQLKATSTFKPAVLKNHYTNAKEVFIQDTLNNIYLLDAKGNILWSKQLESEIISGVSQIDIFKNNKLQMVFNTQNKIYVLDRNGNNVAKFPVDLEHPTKAEVLVADYDSDKNYRFIIPTIDGEIHNYSVSGEKTKGWVYRKTNSVCEERVSFIRIKNKDYLIAIYRDGKITALNRRGEPRLKFKSKLNFPPLDGYKIEGGENLNSTYILTMTTQQDVVKISLSDEKEHLFSISKDSIGFVTFGNIDDDPHIEISTIGNNRLTSYTLDGSLINRFGLRQDVSYPVNLYQFEHSFYYGFTSSTHNKSYVIDHSGEPLPPFPLKGYSPFTITDLNKDGRLNMMIVDQSGIVFTYTLD